MTGWALTDHGHMNGFAHAYLHTKELNKAGVIATNDPVASARQFFALLRGDLYIRRLLDLAPEPTAEEVATVAGEAVSAFLAIHAPD